MIGDASLAAEEHAQQVADAITAGDPAAPWLGGGTAVAPAVRDYTVLSASEQAIAGHWNIGKQAKIGDQGRMVTTVEKSHEAFADPALIVEVTGSWRRRSRTARSNRTVWSWPERASHGRKLSSDVNDVAVSFGCRPRPGSVFTRQA